MLARVVVLPLLVAGTLVTAPPARADGNGQGNNGPVTVGGDYHSGTVTTVVTAPGSSPTSEPSNVGPSQASTDGVTCTWTENSAHLEEIYVNWLGWGDTGGHWYDVKCSDGNVYLSLYVPPAANNVPPPVVLAGSLARRAVNELQLPLPDVHVNPVGEALVGLPEWFWVDASQWRGLSQRTQAGPVWARVTATPTSTSWDPGDGSPVVTCSGPGTPYDKSEPASAQSSDCTYTYTRSSASQPQTGPGANDRYFTVTVTTTWSVTWVGAGGMSGTLPVISRSRSFPLRVAERQSVVTGGSG